MAWKEKLSDYLTTAEKTSQSLSSDISISEFHAMSDRFIESAQALSAELAEIKLKSYEGKEREILDCLTYRWSVDALDVSILFRDAFLKLSKAQILYFCQGGESSENVDVNPEILHICRQAISQNLQLINEIEELKSGVNPNWFHQLSPAATIVEQQDILRNQLSEILDSHNILCKVVPKLNSHKDYLVSFIEDRRKRLNLLKDELNSASEIIENLPSEPTREDIVSASKLLQLKSEAIESEKIVTETFEQFNAGFSSLKVPIHADGGELLFKEISLNKKVESWTENQLFPKLYDADIDIGSLYDSSLIQLFNTRNKLENLALNTEEDFQVDNDQLTRKLAQQGKTVNEYATQLAKEIDEVNAMVEAQLQPAKIYDQTQVFLPELNFTNITKIANQRLWYQADLWSNVKSRVTKFVAKRRIPLINAMQQDPYEFIEERMIGEHDLDTNSLFLKRGYLGGSFYVQRQDEQKSIVNAIKRWEDGYQGSALIVGRRGSGKSSLIEFLPHIIDQIPFVQLTIHNVIKLNGRKHQVTHKIQDSINFLAANSINKPLIVSVDDLENWQNDEQTMYDTIRELTDGIGKYGRRLFFIVSTNHFMHNYINRMFDFNSRFAEIVKTDGMNAQSIVEALVVRHNASLKNFELDDNINVAKRASKIVSNSRNNIGSSMLAWERYIEKRSKMGLPPLSFSKLVNKHHLLLRNVLTHGRLKESVLRKALTTHDNNFISEQVRKLIGFKILERTFDGYLRVNPFIIDEVEYVLLRKTN